MNRQTEPWKPTAQHTPLPNRRLELKDEAGRIVEGWWDGRVYRFHKWGTGEVVVEWRYRRYGITSKATAGEK